MAERIVLLLTIQLSLAAAEAASSNAAELALLQPVKAIHAEQQNVGYAFAVLRDGKVVLQDFTGLAVVEHGVAITPASRFPIMSITKAFTGAALARAAAEGSVDLDAPVRRYLPDYRGDGGERISLRMLAAHTSGLPHIGHPERRDQYVRHYESATDAVSVYDSLPLTAEPGGEYHYSSAGYNLIAAVLERVSGMRIQDYVDQQILRPLGLSDTGFGDVQRAVPRLVRGYSLVDIWSYSPLERLQQVPTWDFSYNHGGGNMYSTVNDLLRFGQELLKPEVFSSQEVELLRQPILGSRDASAWSSGWIIGEDADSRPTIYITGATPGVQASLFVYPEEDLVFAMLANSWGRNSAGGALVIDAPQQVVARILQQDEALR